MKVFFSPLAVYLSHGDGEGREEEGWTSGREGEQSKAQTRTPRRDSNSPRRIRHRMSGGIKAGMASQRGKKKEKAPAASAKNFVKKQNKTKKKSVCVAGKFSLPRPPASPAPYSLFCFVFFVSNGRKYLRERRETKRETFPHNPPPQPPTLPPSLPAELDS